MISPVKIWRRQKEIREILGKKGKILTWTKIHVAAADFKSQVPYPVVLVEFSDGKKALGQLVDSESQDLKMGKKVVAILRRIREVDEEGVIPYGIKFKPIP